MSTPAPTDPPKPPAKPANGSLGVGVLIAWSCLIGGYFLCGLIVSAIAGLSSGLAAGMGLLLALAPWILMIVFAVRYSQRGESRTALGIGVGFASILGVALLLVAACFGLLSNTNFH